ncbi:MAG TPA: alanine racemase [Tissierella sp.]|uniref:ornithine racemase Orr n=1 Tax=Tissierella praeacuta TaxID=43131 RepID=UPI000EE89242|nr:ornithine racemase Orr [Tissierella praeacuta]HAE92504.1 alanine racemase [Tissierella sp.]
MSYPKMTINLKTIRDNVLAVSGLCNDKGIKVAGVTKVFGGNPAIAKAYIEGGISYLADSRIENLIRLKDLNIPKIMLRLPMKSEVDKIVDYADISLNSELDTITFLSEKALEKNKIHKIILMVDLGDLREGYYDEKALFEDVEKIIELKGVKLIGLGTNLTCYGGVIPNKDILDRLTKLEENIEKKYNIELEILSGGNSSTIHLLLKDTKIDKINNLRLGESLVLGTEFAYGEQIEGTKNDAFKLQAEIIEIKEKPSVPIGEIGKDAFGNIPTFIDRGIRKRILCAVGKQDVDFETLHPLDEDIIILGGSSDHLILDGSDSKIDYKVGDIIEFRMSYVSILRAMTSRYVEKEIIE